MATSITTQARRGWGLATVLYSTYFNYSLIGEFTTRNPHATANENLLYTHILYGGFANYGEFLQGGPFHAFS